MLKIASASGAPPKTPLGERRKLPRSLSREGLRAFGNRSFAPLALALSPIFSISVPPKVIHRFTPLMGGESDSMYWMYGWMDETWVDE